MGSRKKPSQCFFMGSSWGLLVHFNSAATEWIWGRVLEVRRPKAANGFFFYRVSFWVCTDNRKLQTSSWILKSNALMDPEEFYLQHPGIGLFGCSCSQLESLFSFLLHRTAMGSSLGLGVCKSSLKCFLKTTQK